MDIKNLSVEAKALLLDELFKNIDNFFPDIKNLSIYDLDDALLQVIGSFVIGYLELTKDYKDRKRNEKGLNYEK